MQPDVFAVLHWVSVTVHLSTTAFIFSLLLCAAFVIVLLCVNGWEKESQLYFYFSVALTVLIASMLWKKNLMAVFLLICFLVWSCACAWWPFFQIIFTFLFCFSFLFLICLNSCFSPPPQPLLVDAYSPRPIPVLCLWKLPRVTNQEAWKKPLGKNEKMMTNFVSAHSLPPLQAAVSAVH